MSKHIETLSQEQRSKRILTVTFAVIAIFYVLPIMLVLINSLKSNSYVNMETFALPNAKSFVGLDNYKTGMTFGNYPFVKSALYSLFITIVSSMLILICTSMAAWYIARVGSLFSRIVYYLCVFSMVVPFQMVMFTLAKTADTLKLNTPWTIPIVYLGFGAGLAVFMFTGFVKALPLEIEEAAAIDGADGVQRFRHITVPLLTPTTVFLLVTTFIASMKVFQSVDVMTGGGPGKATNVMVQWIYNTAFHDFRMERSATVSVVFFIILLVCTALTMKWSNRKTNYDQ